MDTPVFQSWAKIPRLYKDCTITEKIDGTNAQVWIGEEPITLRSGRVVPLMAGSRTRWVFPENDNFGFAAWAYENAEVLRVALGPGRHYGEWWGRKIQRGYGLQERCFSLFRIPPPGTDPAPYDVVPGLRVVPVLYEGPFTEQAIQATMERLRTNGSVAAPGFPNPEGIVIRHEGGPVFKLTFDAGPKGATP